MTTRNLGWRIASVALIALPLYACGKAKEPGEQAEHAEEEGESGPHGGRLLQDGDFSVEVTIAENGTEPQFVVYPYFKDKPVTPADVQLTMSVKRLGGKVDAFSFAPEADYLKSNAAVEEPHSFDVSVGGSYKGKTSTWAYESYEGRTTIAAAQAAASGVKVETARPATIEETIALSGRVELQPSGRADITAWYPGRIVAMTKAIGEPVQKGETLARVTSSESLQTYSIPSPISGIVMARNANAGDVAGASPIYVIADARRVHAEFYVYPRDAERLRAGQDVIVRNLGGDKTARAKIQAILPSADMMTQTIVAHVDLPNENQTWRPGQAVEGQAVISAVDVPLAVRTQALQRFRDFTVVFARVGDIYEVRMLELGRRSSEWTEVLGGLEPSAAYVSSNAYLIRADIEKSGAGHDH